MMIDWQTFYEDGVVRDVSGLIRFDPWQQQLAEKIMTLGPQEVLEAGCGYGQTGYQIAEQVCPVTLLDFQVVPLRTARLLFEYGNRSGRFVQGDLFQLPFGDENFDLVFNAGVLEHFEFADRCRALAEMVRCVRPGGKVIVALPNHFSRPYRYSYLYRQKKKQWPYPDEYVIYDLNEEVKTVGLQVTQTRETICPETAYHFLRRHQRFLFKLVSLVGRFEGYLSVLTFVKLAGGDD
jgi:2-polyprenyl-3-methyl-5-hydroxy-6-metoxy-1,4-benzoquinol methylase